MTTTLLDSNDQETTSRAADKGPLFVVGMWRSGTSLLYALLNQHPQIALMYEGDLPLMAPLFLGGRAKSDWRERWEFWNTALSRHQIVRENLSGEALTLPTAMELAYRQYAGEAIWGCKSPNYYDCMTRLARWFPTARFIVIYRNPADICRSIVRAGRKASWFSRSGMPLRALLGYGRMKKETDSLVNSGARVHVLQYEQLVRDPESVLRAICRFLRIEFDPRMASLASAERSAIYESDHHAMVKGKEIRASVSREEVLSSALRKKIQRYIHLWREQSGGMWPEECESVGSEVHNPSWPERGFDSLLYRCYRLFDNMTAFIFCFAPLPLLRLYREMKNRGQTVSKQADALRSS
jgi:hypothetical protein